MEVELVSTPQPHFIPGYTGYCPQLRYNSGGTYGSLTHKLLINPRISHGEKLILSSKTPNYHRLDQSNLRDDTHLINPDRNKSDLKHLIMPGYTGFLPFTTDKVGHRYSLVAAKAIADFEKHLQKMQCKARMLDQRQNFQESHCKTTNSSVPSESPNVIRILTVKQPEERILTSLEKSSYSRNGSDLQNSTNLGCPGHVHFCSDKLEQNNNVLAENAICNFAKNYQQRKLKEWCTENITGVSKASGPIYEIYHREVGMIPNYAGHVPGFRFGKTFGNDSKDAKQWLRKI